MDPKKIPVWPRNRTASIARIPLGYADITGDAIVITLNEEDKFSTQDLINLFVGSESSFELGIRNREVRES